MSTSGATNPEPLVSIIIPARNEEASIDACLESLVSQSGVSFEIIVVDDDSTDRTRAIAQSFPQVHVIDPLPLPHGAGGKSYACAAGARAARGEWLLFTDADTVHRPGSLKRALDEARAHHASLLSYSPEQEVHGLIQAMVMPVIFAELAQAYRPQEVCDPSHPAAAANGQYLLISREAYDDVGGHRAVAHSLLEDVALATAVKRSGRRLRFRYGGDAVRTRMYRDFASLREGWMKNLALLFPNSGALAAQRIGESAVQIGALGLAIVASLQRAWTPALIGAAIAAPT